MAIEKTTYDMDKEIDYLRYLADYEVATLEEKLREKAQLIIDRMGNVIRKLDEGYAPSSLGELQFTGVEFDMLCARFAQAQETKKRIDRFAQQLTEEVATGE